MEKNCNIGVQNIHTHALTHVMNAAKLYTLLQISDVRSWL